MAREAFVAIRVAAAVALTAGASWAGAVAVDLGHDVDFGAAIKECSKLAEKEDGFVQVCWVPVELWKYSLGRSGTLPSEAIEIFMQALRPYIMVTVADVNMGELGKIEFAPREEVQDIVRLRDRYGVEFRPISFAASAPVAKAHKVVWEEVVAPQFGPLGSATHVFFFSARDGQGRCIADATAAGNFAVLVGEREFEWELPLASLLPPKSCPACGRTLIGVYNFCPYDGAELEGQKVEAPLEATE